MANSQLFSRLPKETSNETGLLEFEPQRPQRPLRDASLRSWRSLWFAFWGLAKQLRISVMPPAAHYP